MMGRDDLPRIELCGDALDLENLALLCQGDHRVSFEEGSYWLRSTEFHGLISNPDGVRERGLALLPLINGAVKARFPGFQPVTLGQCVDWRQQDGRRKRRLSDTVRLQVRSSERVVSQDEGRVAGADMQRWVKLAQSDETIADVLALWGTKHTHDWNTLYKLKEKVVSAVGKDEIVQRGWATQAELRQFEHTANSPAVLGAAARHGVQTSNPPRKPISLGDAQALVDRIIRRWLA